MEDQSREVETQPPVTDGELHLLVSDLKDEVSRYRRREAAWISLAVHGAIILALIFMPKWLPSSLLIVPAHDNNPTMIVLPEDQLKVKPQKANIVSDQDRTAQTKLPDKETLRKLLNPGNPGPPKPPSPPPQPQQQAMQASPAPPQQGAQAPPAPQTTETAKLEAPRPKQNPFALQSPSSSVSQAIQAAANSPHSIPVPARGGDRGSGFRPKVDARGAMDILSDTLGVDFGPYMKRLHVTVEDHWFPLIPEVALPPMMKKGRVVIEFAIMKDGSIQGLTVVSSSGDNALDRAAYGALLNAVPLPRLPVEFTGPFLKIRAAFYYNPDKNDFE
ncbi:MAG TPA: TonB family protein [Candidatus Angelobacter sp.]